MLISFLRSALLRSALLLLALGATTAAKADIIVFDSSFTNPDFVDGGIGFGGSNPDTIIGQNGFQISDSSGAGILDGGSGFNRALFGWTPSDDFNEDFVNNFSSGEIVVKATGLIFNPTGANVGVFGLSNVDAANPLGNSSLAAGVQFTWDNTNLYLDRNTDFAASFDVNTGIVSGEKFDYTQRYSPLGGGLFDIKHYINGNLLTTTLGVTPNFDKSSLEVTGFLQDRGDAGVYSVDGLHLSAVPEPTSLGLLTCGLAGYALHRRRQKKSVNSH